MKKDAIPMKQVDIGRDPLADLLYFTAIADRDQLADFLVQFASGCPPGPLRVIQAMLSEGYGPNPTVAELFQNLKQNSNPRKSQPEHLDAEYPCIVGNE